jgi:hypothetical protein
VPTARDFQGRFLSDAGNARFEMSPKLRADDEAHERLTARADPLAQPLPNLPQ